jgi:ankyrin repeat protein
MDEIKVLFDFAKIGEWNKIKEYLHKNKDIDLNIKDQNDNYLLQHALVQNKPKIVELLLEYGVQLDIVDQDRRSILYLPIKYDNILMIKILLKANKNNIGVSILDIKDKYGHIPLHYAIMFKNIIMIDLLLNEGSNVDEPDDEGNNALHLAIYSRDINICEKILQAKPLIDDQCNTGETALHLGCNFQLVDIVKLLLTYDVNVDKQDYMYEYSALSYCVTLNNVTLTQSLLNKNAKPNLQDYQGNTPLHYIITSNHLEIFDIFKKIKLNVNLYNLEGKLPMHLVFINTITDTNQRKYIDFLLPNTDINVQDEDGNSSLHLLLQSNYWEKYIGLLEKKKMNIFSKNVEGKRPIDYLNKDKQMLLIDITSKSYLLQLKMKNKVWLYDWEQICAHSKPLSSKETDILKKYTRSNDDTVKCYDIIKARLIEQLNSKKDCNISYPNKQKCIVLGSDPKVTFCTFTGATIDLLLGLMYLLKEHKFACSGLTNQFILNKKLQEFYQSHGVVANKGDFLNYEIVWAHHVLFFSEKFQETIKSCIKNKNKRFFISPIGIELPIGSHANYLIIDLKTKEAERFEPNGSTPPYNYDYNSELLDSLLHTNLKRLIPGMKYFSPSDYLPKVGFQLLGRRQYGHYISDPKGFCALWSIWYVDYRLSYPEFTRKELTTLLIKQTRKENIGFRNLIRNYSTRITSLRDNYLKKIGLDINDWINDMYDKEQFDKIVNDIILAIDSLS